MKSVGVFDRELGRLGGWGAERGMGWVLRVEYWGLSIENGEFTIEKAEFSIENSELYIEKIKGGESILET